MDIHYLYVPVRAYVAAIFFLLFATPVLSQTVRYVREGGSGTKDGLSWANASGDLQAMINASANGDQVWVAAGIYIPSAGTVYGSGSMFEGKDQGGFKMKNGVEIYGGFPASGSPGMMNRDWTDNITILSGNNLRAVIVNDFISSSRLNRTAVLDGFTLSNGYASRGGSNQKPVCFPDFEKSAYYKKYKRLGSRGI